MKKLLVLGDSFCHGIGTASVFRHDDNTKFAFGKYIADWYQLDYVNLAEPGISILKTVEVGYNYLQENPHNVEMILIGWTTPGRLGIYSNQSRLQILPNYIFLGDDTDQDVFVSYKNDVKFVTTKQNQRYLDMLPDLHQMIVENDFFDQHAMYQMCIGLFRSWLGQQNFAYQDFSVFGDVAGVQLTASFNKIMDVTRHPNKQEQKMFADLLLKELA